LITIGGVISMFDRSGSGRWVFAIGGSVAALGAVLGMVGNLIHPVTPIEDPAGVARVIADSEIWVPAFG